MKGFDVLARGPELLQFRSSVALILVKTCLWERKHLLYRWNSRSSPIGGSAFGAPDYSFLFHSASKALVLSWDSGGHSLWYRSGTESFIVEGRARD